MFRPIAAIFRLLQFCSKIVIYIYIYICLYCVVMLSIYSIDTYTHTHTHIYIYIYIYIVLFEQNCNNLKMAAIGRKCSYLLC